MDAMKPRLKYRGQFPGDLVRLKPPMLYAGRGDATAIAAPITDLPTENVFMVVFVERDGPSRLPYDSKAYVMGEGTSGWVWLSNTVLL